MMQEKYNNYLNSYKNLDIEEKKEIIISNLDELLKMFMKINIDFQRPNNILPIEEDYENDDEFLIKLFTQILTLKEISAETINIILDNFYEGDKYE